MMYKQNERHHKLSILLLIRAIVMTILSLICLYPFLWMVGTGFKTESEMYRTVTRIIPEMPVLDNYVEALTGQYFKMSFGSAFLNSIFLAIVNTFVGVLFASLAAFSFAKLRFRGKKVLFMSLLATMMIPGQVTMIPMFIIFKNLGMYNTYWPLTLPGCFLYAYGVFLLRQYYSSIPDAYMDSGKLDGAGYLRIWLIIYMPLAMPAVASLLIFKFMGSWNSFMSPMIYLSSSEKYTLPIYIRSLKQDYGTKWSLLMAASTLSVIPTMIIYIFGQRFFVEGITIGGVKG